MGVDQVRGSNIQFNFKKASNLRKKDGKEPNLTGVYAQYALDDTSKAKKTSRTRLIKGRDPVWDENINLDLHRDTKVNPQTKVQFIVVDKPNEYLPLRFNKIAHSKEYTVHDLLTLRDAQGSPQEGFSVSLTSAGEATNGATLNTKQATLTLTIRDFWSVDDKQIYNDQVAAQWKTRNQEDFNLSVDNLRRDLVALSADLPLAANAKTVADVAMGTLNLVVDLSTLPELHEDRTVICLLSSHCDSLKKVREKGPHDTPDVVVQIYEQLCLKIIYSLRLLVHLCSSGLKIARARANLTTQISKETEWFDAFTGKEVIKARSGSLRSRASRRKDLLADKSRAHFTTLLKPLFEMDPPTFKIKSRNPSVVTQLVSSWALSTPSIESQRVLWLYGGQECGKTQFASTLVEAYSSLGIFPAYFSFGDAGNIQSMASTLAFQLAAYNDEIRIAISNAVLNAPTAEAQSFEKAFKDLVLDPLSSIKEQATPTTTDEEGNKKEQPLRNPLFIILDNLDRVSSPTDLSALLSTLVENIDRLPKHARILVLSRELPAVRQALEDQKLVTTSEFAGEGTEGTPMSPVFAALKTSFGGSLEEGGGSAPRSSSIKWTMPKRKGSGGSSNGKGKRKSAGSAGSLGSIEELEKGDVNGDASKQEKQD